MSQATLELSDPQREMLMRGLRFVRRSYTLSFRDTDDLTEDERADGLRQVQELNHLLECGIAAKPPARAR